MASRTSAAVKAAWIGAAALIVTTLVTLLWPRGANDKTHIEAETQAAQPASSFEAFVLNSRFAPSGWMGDGKHGEQYLKLEPGSTDINGEQKIALRVEYSPGPDRWAGVYWQHPDGNWGQQPGLSLVGAREIAFLARGARGGEVVEFQSGGIRGEYSDSFEKSLGQVALTKEWKAYRIDLQGETLSNVIGAFAWVAPAPEGQPLEFWLADLQVR